MTPPLLLVYRALGLGDLLCGVPALRAIREAHPGHRVVLAAPRALAPLAELSGAVDAVLDTAPLAVPTVHDVDLAVNLHGRGPESHRAILAARPRRMIAFACDLGAAAKRDGARAEIGSDEPWAPAERNGAREEGGRGARAEIGSDEPWAPAEQDGAREEGGHGARAEIGSDEPWDAEAAPAWRPGEHEVHRWCRLLAESGIPADPRRLDLPAPPWPAPPGAEGASLVHPGAASPARRWPPARWAAVARAERRAGRAVVVTGSAVERPLAEAVAREAGLPGSAVLAGRTDLRALAAAVAAAARVFSADTGVAHLATALGTPSVVLFGPTPPAEWGPPTDRPQHVALHRGGRGDPHGDAPDPRLLAISVGDVLDAAA